MPPWDNGTPPALRAGPFGHPGSIPGGGVLINKRFRKTQKLITIK